MRGWILTAAALSACGGEATRVDGTVTVSAIEANQGVAISVVEAGRVIPSDERAAPLLGYAPASMVAGRGRRTAIRARWQHDGSPSEARVEFALRVGTGDPLVSTRTATLADGAGWLTWELAADALDGRDTVRITSELGDDQLVGVPNQDIPLYADLRRARIRVTLVPMTYMSATCVADSTDAIRANLSKIRDRILAFNPVQQASIEIRGAPIALAEDESFIPAALAKVGDAREADAPNPDVYYVGVIDDCTMTPVPGSRGASITSDVPPTAEAADRRVAVVRWFEGDPTTTFAAITHELGHTQGLDHVRCPEFNDVPLVDDTYPHPDGRLGGWGYHVVTGALVDPGAHFDYMGYCQPHWPSDFSWAKTHAQIVGVTALTP